MRPPSLVAVAALFFSITCAFAEDEAPAVVPYRPSVGTSAELPAPGWPELEAGVAWAKGADGTRAQSSPLLFKLAWSESWAMLIGTDAYDWQRSQDGVAAHSGGYTALGLKYKLPVDEHLALGAQAALVLPTARGPIGSGHSDWGLLGIASFDYPGVHVDLNLGGVHIGSVDTGLGRWQGAWATAASHPLDERFAVKAELSGIAKHGTPAQTQALVALSYNVSRALVLDVAVAAGLSRSAADLQVMTGFTVQLGHWF
jgi:hypothetical protein